MLKKIFNVAVAVIGLTAVMSLGGRATLYRAWSNDHKDEMTFDEYVKYALRKQKEESE